MTNTPLEREGKFLPNLKFLTLALSLSFATLASANSMIAIVDDDVITFDTIAKQVNSTSTKAQKIALVNQQIDLVLQLKQIQKIGIVPKPKSIDTMLGRIASQNKLTRNQLQASPEFDSVVENITQRLALNGLKQVVLRDVEVNLTQAEIDAGIAQKLDKDSDFGKQIKIAQILVNSIQTDTKPSKKTQDELIQEFLAKLRDKINNGTSFVSLAKLHSQDPSYKNGGESEWLSLSKLPTAIKKQLQKLEPEQVSQPFATSKGWVIIKIIQQRFNIESQLASIKSQLIRSQKNTYFKNWVKKLRKNVYIEIFEHNL